MSPPRSALPEPPVAVPVPARPRLLLVDDQAINIQALYQVFAADHQVLMATSGAQALALCASQLPDLVLLDVQMPGMNGYEVCRRLKSDSATRDIPVIFVTAQNDDQAETQGLEVGAVDFISKPFNPKIVRARVRTHLTLKAQADLLRQWVYTDGLTGVNNRRSFDEHLAAECARARRNHSQLSVLMIDVDHFKRYNDKYGHQAGDQALRRVAHSLQQGVRRPGDLLARYGGEEFVTLLPETDLGGALELAVELGLRVAELGIIHDDSPLGQMLTVSLGACTLKGSDGGSAEALLRAADEQLYLAKTRGRNQACGVRLEAG